MARSKKAHRNSSSYVYDAPDESTAVPPLPPDGGWGWVVVIASLFINIIVDGVCFSFGVFYVAFLDHFGESKGKTAWVGSLIPGMYLGMGEYSRSLVPIIFSYG